MQAMLIKVMCDCVFMSALVVIAGLATLAVGM